MKTKSSHPNVICGLSTRALQMRLCALLALAGLSATPLVQAATDTWSGGGTGILWSDAANWSGTTPANGDDLVFAGATRLFNSNNIVGLDINSITYNSSGFLNVPLTASYTLMITNGLTDNAGNNTNNIPLILGGSQTFQNASGVGVTQLGGTINMSNYSLTIGGAGNLFLNGVVSGNGAIGVNALNMNGSGILRLAAANTFNGGVNLNSGTVQLGNGGGIPNGNGKGNLNIATGATLDLGNQSPTVNGLNGMAGSIVDEITTNTGNYNFTLGTANSNGVFAGTIQNTYGTISLVKNGTGAQTNSGNNTYSGSTTVNGGILDLGGANSYVGSTRITAGTLVLDTGGSLNGSTNYVINPGGLFDFSGAGGLGMNGNLTAGRTSGFTNDIIGNLTLDAGNLTPVPGSAGTMTLDGNLTLFSPTLYLDLRNVATPGGGTNDLIVVNGTLDISGGITTIKANPISGSFNGTYTLITSTNPIIGGPANLALESPRGITAVFDTTTQPSNVLATVTGSPNPASLVWAGNGSGGSWDVLVSQNWLSNGVPDYFYNLDSVTFDDSATANNSLVNLPGAVSPTSVTVNNSVVNYTLGAGGDPGVISGTTGLAKNGTGLLTLNTANNYTGDTVVNGGTLIIGDVTSGAGTGNTVLYSGVPAGTLSLAASSLFLIGLANPPGGSETFTLTNLIINAGGSCFGARGRQANDLASFQINGFTRNTGGTFDINNMVGRNGSHCGVYSTVAPVNGILGGYATWNFSDWLVPANTGNGFAALAAAKYQTNANPTVWTATTNVSLTVNTSSDVNTTTINTLKLSGSTVTISSGQTLTLATGGLLMPTTGGASAINGGTLLGAAGADLIVLQNGAANVLTIGSVIADNTSATALTKAGQGTLMLTGDNTYSGTTYINGTTINGASSGATPTFYRAGALQIGNGGTSGGISNSPSIVDNGVLAFDRSDTIGYMVPISGIGGISQMGAGTTVLAADNTFSGPVTITAGTLQIGNGGASGSFSNAASVTTSGALVVNRTGTITYPGPISGIGGSLTVQGGGTVILDGTNTYTGSTTVSAGTLALGVNGVIASSTLTVASGAIFDTAAAGGIVLNGAGSGQVLAGSGQVNGNVASGTGTRISPAGDGVIGTLTLNNDLTLNGGTLTVDANGAGSRDLLLVNGNMNLTSGIVVWNNTGAALPDGSYKIIGYSGTLTGAAGNLSVSGFSQPGQIATLSSATAGEIDLVVTTYNSVNLVWQGDGVNNPWDVATTTDWTNSAGIPTLYHQNDNATFNDSSANTTVNLQASLTPNQINVNGTVNSYTFQGSGSLAGGTLTNNNPNTLTILTVNTYSGNTTINAGTVQFGNGTAAGTIGSGPVLDNGSLVFNEPAGLAPEAKISGAISGTGSLSVQAGSLTLSGNNASYNGGVTVNPGTTLQVGLGTASGTLGAGPVTNNGSLVIDSTATTLNYGGIISGSGTVSNLNVGTLTLNGANTYSGGTFVVAGTLKVGAAGAIPTGAGAANVVVNGGASSAAAGTLDLNGFDAVLNGLDGVNGTVKGLVVNNAGSAINTLTLGNGDGNSSFAGQIKDNTGVGGKVALTKTGLGTNALDVETSVGNTYSGGTIVSNGVLNLISSYTGAIATYPAANQVALGSGPVTFDGGTIIMVGGFGQSTSPTWAPGATANTFIIPANQTGTIYPPQRGSFDSKLTGSGTLYYNSTYVRGSMGGDWSGFAGQIVLNGVNTGSFGNYLGLDTALGMPNARLFMGTNVSFYGRVAGTPTIAIGELAGGDDSCEIASTSPGGGGGLAANFMVGGLNTTTNFNGRIIDNVGLIKVGTGTLTLTNANLTYTGLTAVSNGMLVLTAAIPNSSTWRLASPGVLDISQVGTPLSVGASAGQTIQGNGTLNGSLALGGLGTNIVGFANHIGTLTVTNDANLSGEVDMELNEASPGGGTNDQVAAATIELAGTLNVTNIGPALHVGDTFKLFNASGTLSGTFTSVNLATNDANGMLYTWTDNTAVNGTVTVLTVVQLVNTNPPPINFSVSGNTLSLSWPTNAGWTLLVQTNNLSAGVSANTNDWMRVPGSSAVTQTNLTLDPTMPTEFYRLTYP